MSRTQVPPPDEINQLFELYNMGCYTELENRSRELLVGYPDSGIAWQLMGGALQMQGKDALHAFQKTAELFPDDAQAHYNLGVTQKSLGHLADAVASYRRALKLKPDFAEAQKNLENALQSIRHQTPLKEFSQYVFIVGAQKAGTTALHAYLAEHPMVVPGFDKEVGFFHKDAFYEKGDRNYRYGFPDSPSGTHALDATPEYMYHAKNAGRIHAFKSDAKIIMLLREPVSRAFSEFNMYRKSSRQSSFRKFIQFSEADAQAFYTPLIDGHIQPEIRYFIDREMAIINGEVKGEEPALIRRGIYAPQLERFIDLFGRDNVLVLFSDDLKREPEKIVNQVLDFVGLEPMTGVQYPPKHVGEYTVENGTRDEIKQCAAAMFEKDKQELRDIYGLNVPW